MCEPPGIRVRCPLRGLAGKAWPLALGCTGPAAGQRGLLPPEPGAGLQPACAGAAAAGPHAELLLDWLKTLETLECPCHPDPTLRAPP